MLLEEQDAMNKLLAPIHIDLMDDGFQDQIKYTHTYLLTYINTA